MIDLHSNEARHELIEKYGLRPHTFDRLTRSSFESHPRSITELAMIGKVGTSDYLEAFLRECTVKDLEGLRVNRLSVWTRANKRFRNSWATQTSGPYLLRPIEHDCSSLGEIKLNTRISIPSNLRSCFCFPSNRVREAGRDVVLIRSKRSQDSNVRLPPYRRLTVKCE